jgi:hypothetical protein
VEELFLTFTSRLSTSLRKSRITSMNDNCLVGYFLSLLNVDLSYAFGKSVGYFISVKLMLSIMDIYT